MTLKSFAERLGSIIETLQRINISFNLSKASLDPEDEFKADYLIDNLQQHVAKLLTIKVHSPEPVKQKGKAKQKQLITDNFDLEDEDFFSSPNKQKDNLDNVEIKTEITESPDKTEQNTAASKSDSKATPSGNVSNPEQIFVSGHRVSTEEDEDVTVKLEVEDAADVPDADAASDCTDEYVGGAADFTEEDAHDLTGGVNFDDDDDFDMEKEEEKMTNKPKRGRPSKSKTEQAKSTEAEQPEDPRYNQVLKKYFGYNKFRPVGRSVDGPVTRSNTQTTAAIETKDMNKPSDLKTMDSNEQSQASAPQNNEQLTSTVASTFGQNAGMLYKCGLCPYTSYIKYNFQRHKNNHSSGAVCDQCGKSYVDNYALELHVKFAHMSLKLSCEDCGRSFRSVSGLRSHRRSVHEKIYKYNCDICDQKFSELSHLKGHINKHLKLKPEKCTTCGKSYAFKASLSKHKLKCGKREKPKVIIIKCTVCDKVFKNQKRLLEHMRGKHGGKSYSCKECNRQFNWRSSLRKHMSACKRQRLSKSENKIASPAAIDCDKK